MTEIPEHLLKRAQKAREAAGGSPVTASDVRVPAHLLERSAARRAAEGSAQTSIPHIRPAMPEKPPMSRDDVQDQLNDVVEDVLDMALDAPNELARMLNDALGELVDGSLFELKIAREDGKTTVNITLADKVLAQLAVNLLKKL